MNRIFNFSAGPATLPTEVLEQARDELLDFQGTGMSVMEMSHRGKVFEKVHNDSIENLKKIASIPDRFDVLYMTGGASTQFALIPLNHSATGKKAGYVNTGSWSKKAIEQAKIQKVEVHDAGNSADTNFNNIPENLNLIDGLDYLHITSNNTIFGTQWQTLPDPGNTRLAIDMSSDFLSKPIDWSNIGIAYAGTQKNAGPSGLTVVVIDRELYKRESEDTPTMFRYSTYGKNDSLYNTPPTFQIYMFGLILKWIESKGGLTGILAANQKKAAYIYDVMDEFPDYYRGHSEKKDRSLMNITFTMKSPELEAEFLKQATERKLDGLKGHRSVGGLRASIYNAMPEEGCKALADFMRQFKDNN